MSFCYLIVWCWHNTVQPIPGGWFSWNANIYQCCNACWEVFAPGNNQMSLLHIDFRLRLRVLVLFVQAFLCVCVRLAVALFCCIVVVFFTPENQLGFLSDRPIMNILMCVVGWLVGWLVVSDSRIHSCRQFLRFLCRSCPFSWNSLALIWPSRLTGR